MEPAPHTRLDSWKVIAEYLGRNVRTAMRWAEERGMPVHRVPGGKRGAVFAFTDEVDTWLSGQEEGAPRAERGDGEIAPGPIEAAARPKELGGQEKRKAGIRRLILWVCMGASLAVVVGIVMLKERRASAGLTLEFARAEFEGNLLNGEGADGQVLWSYRFSRPLAKMYVRREVRGENFIRVADFFGDGRKEVAALAPLEPEGNPNQIMETDLDFLSGAGKVLWRYVPSGKYEFGSHELDGPWVLQDMVISDAGGERAIWATSAHYEWGNSFVVKIDPRSGKNSVRFVNSGTLHTLGEVKTAKGTYLLAGGFNNEWNSGSLAITLENREFAASPQTPGTRHYCDSCPPGKPDDYFVFPRTEVNRVNGVYEDFVSMVAVTGEGIEVVKLEGGTDSGGSTVYLLNREEPFGVISLRYDSSYDALHRQWSEEGKIKHSLENCPERLHPQPVRLWTPTGGWTELPVKAEAANQ